MNRVAVFSLGGTIAMTPGGPAGPVIPTLDAADLVAAVPGLAASGIEVEVHPFRQLPGASLTLDDLGALVSAARARVVDGVDGVVVTQGTDTIEETAFALDLQWTVDAPLVVTGALRSPTMAGADGPANLLAAILTAADPTARAAGCLVVLADEIHAARWVRKAHSTSPGAFRSPDIGPVGYLAEGRPYLVHRPVRAVPRIAHTPLSTVRTAVIPVVLGDDGELLRRAAGGFDGLVVAGFGVGHVPVGTVDILTTLAGQIPVVLATRVAAGPVLTRTYGFAGSESDLLRRGLIGAGSLDAYKARILLHLMLASGADRDGIVRGFQNVGAPTRPPVN